MRAKPRAQAIKNTNMEMRSSLASDSSTLLTKIQDFTLFLLKTVCQKRELPYVLLDRYQSYCSDSAGKCACGSGQPSGKEMISFGNTNQGSRLDALLRVLLIIQKLLFENKHISKRDIYYMHPSVFSAQAVVDQAINDICVLLECSRHNLNVVSVGSGLVMGWLRFQEAGRPINCLRRRSNGYPIPVHAEDIEDLVSFAEYILVVEKETVFQRLSDDGFCETNKCIIITGRGYPDVPTRRFLRLLVEHLNLPAYCLVDCDPHGFDILATYRFGSMKMAYDTKLLQVPNMHWLGVFPSDCDKYNLPDRCCLPLNQTEVRKIEAMLKRCYLQREAPQWRAELEVMLQNGVKFEIEALSVSSISFLSETYLPTKLRAGIYV